MRYYLQVDGRTVTHTDEYNKATLRRDSGREVSKLLRRPGSHLVEIIDGGGSVVSRITVDNKVVV
jgi:hypothetical protein